MQTLEKKLEKKKELEKLYPYDLERQFFEMWKFNDPNLPKEISLKKFQKWCRIGYQKLPKKPWTEYLKEVGAYYLSENLIVKAIKDYHEDHDKYPKARKIDASKYFGFKITWTAINGCLRLGGRGLPGGSSLYQLRKEHSLGVPPDLTEDLIVKAMKDYFEEHNKYPVQASGDASKYIGFETTWMAINACLKQGCRGLPGGSSLYQLKLKFGLERRHLLTEDLIVKAMKDYFEEHNKYPKQKSGDASKYVFQDIHWSGVDSCLRKGRRGLPGGSSLAQLIQKHFTGLAPNLTEEIIVKAMKDYFEEHNKYPSKKYGDASEYLGFKITWLAIDSFLRREGSSLAQLRKKYTKVVWI